MFELTPLVQTLIERRWIGEKTGQGFYKRSKTADGASDILTLDPATLTYRPKQSVNLPALDAALAGKPARQRGHRRAARKLGRAEIA